MLITRVSILSSIVRTRDIDVTDAQLAEYYVKERPAQEAFSNLSASDREFIMTGIIDSEWDEVFPPDEVF